MNDAIGDIVNIDGKEHKVIGFDGQGNLVTTRDLSYEPKVNVSHDTAMVNAQMADMAAQFAEKERKLEKHYKELMKADQLALVECLPLEKFTKEELIMLSQFWGILQGEETKTQMIEALRNLQ